MRVVVCDDSGLFRRRMVVGLEVERDIEVIAECDDAEQAIRECRDLTPDVVFVGIQIAQIGGVRTTAGICEVVPTCRVVVVLGAEDFSPAVRALRAGAVGFLSRDDAVPRAALTTRQVASGQVSLLPGVAGQLLAEYDAAAASAAGGRTKLPFPRLTNNEILALEHLRDSISTEGSAAAMGLPVATVHALAASAVLKIHRHARSEAVLLTVADKIYAG